ncbi:MAG TPA: hypothetical protein VJX94_13945 [Stellaceae bacterium]|nr:hypothetical protein [Stellaceae bacterium]
MKVDPAPVEAEHLVQAGLRLVPGFLARLGEVDADRDRSDLALRTVVAELAQQLLVFAVAAPSPRRQVIAAPRGPGHTLVAHRGHPDRRAGFLHRGRRHADIGEIVVFALVAERLSSEAALDDPQRLEGPPEPFVERDAEAMELLRGRADADRQIDPAARDVVENRDVLGDPHRVVQGQKQHIGTDANPLGARRHRGQKRDRRRVPRVFREVVFARPDIVEGELFGEHRLLQVVPIEVLQRPRTARQLADPHRDD